MGPLTSYRNKHFRDAQSRILKTLLELDCEEYFSAKRDSICQ